MTDTLDRTDQQTADPLLASLQPFFLSCERNFKQYNLLASQVAAAEGDRDAAVKAWMDGSSDPEAVAIRQAIANAEAKLRSMADVAVGDSQVSEEEKTRLKQQLETLTKKVKSSTRGLRGLAEPFGISVDDKLRDLGDPFAKAAPTGSGSTLPRPSVYVECMRNGKPDQVMTFPNLSQAASHMDIPLEDLGKLYASAAGVPYEEVSKVKTVTNFEWTHGTNGNVWTIKTTPKESARGREAVSKAPAASDGAQEPTQSQEDVA